jgi:hypothetical protein
MTHASPGLTDRLGSLAGKWTAYTAFGTFLLYLLGYLTLRFQLSTYGVVTDLDAFDEKYLFAGSRFLVFLVASVPNVLLIVMACVAVAYLPYRLVPRSWKARITQGGTAWMAAPERLPLLGTVLALAMIQLLLRKCFVFGNLLLAQHLPEDEWINGVLLGDAGDRALYFTGLVGGTLLTGGVLLLAARRSASATTLSTMLAGVLVFLVAVEFLLLPVNYGILIASQELPRVTQPGNNAKLAPGAQSWLVWESKEAVTYLIRTAPDGRRTMITMPRKDMQIAIVAYENIFRVLFASAQAGAASASSKGGPPP